MEYFIFREIFYINEISLSGKFSHEDIKYCSNINLQIHIQKGYVRL